MRPSPFIPLVILATLSLLLAVVVTETVLYSRNTPVHHPEWVLSKLLVPGDLMGSAESFETRNLLRRNRLNLNEWHGFQETLLDRIVALGSLRAHFSLGSEAYLIAIFNKNAAGYSGIRISRNPLFPNLFFRAADEGGFIETLPLESFPIDGGWHELDLLFKDGTLHVSVNDEAIGEIEESSLDQQLVGLRSGRHTALVDEIAVVADDGTLIIAEDFRNRRGLWTTLPLVFAATFLIAAAIYLASRRPGRDGKPALFSIILIEVFLVIVFLFYFLFDYYHYSENYYYEYNPDFAEIPANKLRFEAARQYLFTQLPFVDFENDDLVSHRPEQVVQFLGANPSDEGATSWLRVVRGPTGGQEIDPIEDDREAIEVYLDRKPLDSAIRILVLGSSQTWGEGAKATDARIAPTLQRILSQQLGPKHSIAVVNGARKGTRSGPLLDRYRSHLFLFRPDIVVANLSSNDRGNAFAGNLAEIVEMGRDIGAQTLFVLEANSIEQNESIRSNHETMRETAASIDVALVDLNGYLAHPSVRDSGIIWWDFVHLTSYGQRLAAEFIGRALFENFKLGDETPPSAGPSGTDD
ncbi:MAG: SGNH/GDSL hydrolase family protein [Alphaproteobacteria bacterium]|nr:SGNH/GDSL hydrolase family protein [Alphaproteobacteria bacterium]